MGSKSDFLELALLNHVYGGPDYVRAATVYVALFTVAPTDAAGGTEVSGGSYARAAVTNNAINFPAASGGSKSNAVAITMAVPSADWGVCVAFGLFDALTAGNLLAWSWLGSDAGKVFTAAVTDVFTAPAHGYADTQQVRIVAIPGGALPAGVSAGVTYFIRDATADTFKLAATSGGAALDITAAGAGLVATIIPKTINSGDTVTFAIGALVVSED